MSPHTKTRSLPNRRENGSATIVVLGFMVVISMIFGAVLTRTMNTYRQVSHIASWQESMVAAETGAEFAMAELRKTITDPENAFATWSTTDENGELLPHNAKRRNIPRITHAGEGNTEMDASVTIDAPTELLDGKWRQWYRIRSTGTTYLPGGATVVTGDKRDSTLRKLSMHRNPKTNKPVNRAQTSRVIELLVKPISFENAIVSDEPLIMNNQGIYVDSYDSRYESTSTDGLYDATKAAKNGDIATNSELIEASFATINGDAFTDQGKIVDGANITGEQRDDFSLTLNAITAPDWPSYQTISGNGAITMLGGTKASPKRYKMNNLKITGNEVVTFGVPPNPDPAVPGVETYIEVWITGDFATSGNGSIAVNKFTNVVFFLEGNIDIGGGGTMNADSQPGRLQIMCVNPPPNQSREIKIQGNGILVAAIYGPGHDVIFGATGSEGTMWGAITGKSIEMGGKTVIHYDEALAEEGYIVDYRARSWFEDTK
jgi:hypothetical protein